MRSTGPARQVWFIRLAGLLVVASAGCGGESGVPIPPSSGAESVWAFTGGRVIVGDGDVIEDATFVVRDDLILDVGRAGEVEVPVTATIIDLTGQTVMPALVNTHAHLGWERYTSWGSEQFARENLIDHLYRHAYFGVGTIIGTLVGARLADWNLVKAIPLILLWCMAIQILFFFAANWVASGLLFVGLVGTSMARSAR